MTRKHIASVAAILAGIAASGMFLSSPAAAASCPKGTGVTVVVGSDVRCDASGAGKPAVTNFRDVGHTLASFQGFVCRIDGSPSVEDEPCNNYPPADAYWGLFWSNGSNGSWAYSQSGAGSLTVPAGGWVGFVFQHGSGKTYPSMTPLGVAAQPKPKPHAPSGTTGSGGASASPSATPSASTTAPNPSKSDKKSNEKKSGSASPTDGSATTQPGDDLTKASQETAGSGTLGWIAAVLAVVLLAGMGGVVWRRRTAGGRTP